MSVESRFNNEGQLSRRGFLSGVVAAGALVATGGAACAPREESPRFEEERDPEAMNEAYRLWWDIEGQIEHFLTPVSEDERAREYVFPSARKTREQGSESASIPLHYMVNDNSNNPLELRIAVDYREVIPGNREASVVRVCVDCGVALEGAESAWFASEWRITEQNPLNRIVDGEASVAFILEVIGRTQPAMQRAAQLNGTQMALLRTGDVLGLRVAPDDEAMASDGSFEEPTKQLVKDAGAIVAGAADEIAQRIGT